MTDELDLTVTLDGVQHKLEDLDWALLKPCGCTEAITLAVCWDEVLANAAAAWRSFEPHKRDRERLIKRGYTVKLMPRQDAAALFYRSAPKCTHYLKGRKVDTVEPVGDAL